MEPTRIPLRVPTRAPTGETNCFLLGERQAFLLDPAARSDDLDAALDGLTVAHVAVTHHHPDHVGAVAHYADEHDATVWARFGREAAFERATGVAPDRTFREGTVIPTDAGPVTVVETPGHAPEHVAFALDDALLVGDLAVVAGSVVVGDPEGDRRAYLASLRRLWARDPAVLYPAHGPVIDAPRETLARLIRHRKEREARVEATVLGGAQSVPEITDAAYEKDISGVRDLAEATVRAHLKKLAVEGRVVWDGEHASPV
jgi:ribonuclease/clavin/mitogillin